MAGEFDLERFVKAQENMWKQAREELLAGRKRTHWMWFMFPQLRGLGASATAERYGIVSLAEARAYLAHPVLGPRLRELTETVNGLEETDAGRVFGYPDDLKFCSSMTLFAEAASDEVFSQALVKWFGGKGDMATLERLHTR